MMWNMRQLISKIKDIDSSLKMAMCTKDKCSIKLTMVMGATLLKVWALTKAIGRMESSRAKESQ